MSRRRRRILNITGFNPIALSPVLWLDANDSRTITESGGSVSQWDDKSGNSNDVTQGTGSAQPTTDASTQNGKNVLDFDGGDSLIMPSGLFSIPNGDNTTFVVAQTSLTTTVQRLIVMSETSSSRYNLEYESLAGDIEFQSKTAVGGAVTKSGITKTNYNIIRARREGTTQALTFNGETEATNLNGASESGVDAARIGSFDGSFENLTGSIAEILIYSRSLSVTEIASVEAYLTNKWGI